MDKLVSVTVDCVEFFYANRVAAACGVTAIVGVWVFRHWMQGGVCRSKVQLNGKTVLITGANSGIGKETARDLARRGARVILACRDLTRGETAATEIRKSTGNGNVVVYKLDLASLKSVRSCAEEVKAKEQRLDILINNAGVLWSSDVRTEDGFVVQFGTNHLGHFLLTNLLLDLLKASAPSRIVNVASGGHILINSINFDAINCGKSCTQFLAYNQSKLANVLFTRELDRRLKGTNVTSYSLHPGVVDTELVRVKDQFCFPVRMFMNCLYYGLVKYVMKSSLAGAQTSIYCAVEPGIEHLSGKYFSDCREKAAAPQGQDDEAAARLWTVSEEMVGLKSSEK